MTCRTFKIGDATAIVCSRGERRKRCQVPHCDRPCVVLCDAPVGTGTCDRQLCATHRTEVGPDRDLCPAHAKAARP